MNKRKKTQVSEENQKLPISKAKKTYKRKRQATRDCNLEKPTETSDFSNTLPEATVGVAVKECKEQNLDDKEMEILPTVLDESLAEESKNVSTEKEENAMSFAPPSQGGRFVPIFVKTKNKVPGRCEVYNSDVPGIQMKQDVLESSEAEYVVRNELCDTAEKAFQSTAAPSESLELMDSSVKNKEDAGDQGILPCEETQDVKVQNQDRIISISNSDAVPRFIDSQVKEAQKPTDTPAIILEKQKMKSKNQVSFFLHTSVNKDAEGFEGRDLSPGSLHHVERNQNEETPEGPTLQTEHGTKSRCEKLVPIVIQSKCDTCDLRPDEISKSLPKRDADQQIDGKEKTAMCAEHKLVCVEGSISSAEIISQLDGVVVKNESSRENPGPELQGSMAQMCSAIKDPLSVDLDFLLNSQVQSVFESNNLEHPPQPNKEVLESSEAECMVGNEPRDTAEKAFQSTAAPSESLELMDSSVKNKEDAGDQGILPCEETQDVKVQNQDRIVSINNGDAVPRFIDSQVKEAQKPTDTPANILEKQKMKSKKQVSFFLCTSDNKDTKSFKGRKLSPGSLGHVKRNQNEEAPEGPTLQTKHGTKNRCKKLVPIIKQSKCDTCDLRPNEISKSSPKEDADQQMDGKEKTVMCVENKLVFVEGCVSSAEDGVGVKNESSRENPGPEAQESMAQMCSAIKDPLSVDLDFLLDSQVQSVFESNNLDHPPQPNKLFSLDVPHAARGTKSIANVAQPNNGRDERIARGCAPSKEEDATNVVCGLIKELSKLNRLVMSTHRDLDSFRRLKFRKYRQSGKLLPHSMDTATNMQYTVKKKKKMSLANTLANFNVCKDFLCSRDISSAVKNKAVVMSSVEADF